MRAEIVATGDEIRTGALVDSNSAHIADQLEQAGIEVTRHHAVGDDLPVLVALLHEIGARAEVAVVTGGLGPTEDDLSAAAAARALGVGLVLDQQALEEIEAYFTRRGRPMTASNRKQAMFPEGARRLPNPIGTAPGFRVVIGGCAFYFLPGVPHEMRRMLQEQVLPDLHTMQGAVRDFRLTRVISTFGLPESVVGEKVAAIHQYFPDIKLGLRAKFPEIQVKLYLNTPDEAQGGRMLDGAARWVSEALGINVFSLREGTMAEEVGALLRQQNATLALAESCTGGLIANWLTNIAGSSDYFLFGAVTYANPSKIQVLGVEPETLEQYGAVHETTAQSMARGARRIAGATYGLATSGIAGPGGGTAEKPVGTLCIGLDGPMGTRSRTVTLSFGQRLMNKRLFAMIALDLLRRALLEQPDQP
ncbi:competence/damage-inducible protein A [Desulfatitalea alkaliphila]|uniref:CinA-like protein n=1 Tax=Desulfatitalea alkaliphila TaxID=2929485 RepID=A0AA41R8N2_9BACT|nr:competence/damage-inducible protein A [Desulfatitalea alkaliphila]MCJ8503065.1 competence/damage-inducible protein A [Desulfatitalea alkaliphila]